MHNMFRLWSLLQVPLTLIWLRNIASTYSPDTFLKSTGVKYKGEIEWSSFSEDTYNMELLHSSTSLPWSSRFVG